MFRALSLEKYIHANKQANTTNVKKMQRQKISIDLAHK